MSADTKSRARQIKVGDTFRSTYADSNALWRITRNRGRGVWEAVIEDEPFTLPSGEVIEGDYAGVVDVFRAEHIRRCMAWSDMFTNLANDQDAWFEAQEVGTVLHYCNGFSQFVRGEVVVMDETNSDERGHGDRIGKKGLLPTALVGNVLDKATPGKQGWFAHDIVRRFSDGEVRYGYHAEHILSGKGAWQPSITCVYEAPGCSSNYSKGPDPRTMPVIDLSPPEATDPDAEAVVRHYNEVRAILNETPRDEMDALAKLAEVKAVLARGPEFATWKAESNYRNGS